MLIESAVARLLMNGILLATRPAFKEVEAATEHFESGPSQSPPPELAGRQQDNRSRPERQSLNLLELSTYGRPAPCLADQ